MGNFIYQWIDLLWIPIALFVVDKKHRVKTIAFIVTCMLTMRTQIELIEGTGFAQGFTPFFDAPMHTRGLIVYGTVIMLFLMLAHFSHRTQPIIFFAATLSIYFIAFVISMIVMVL